VRALDVTSLYSFGIIPTLVFLLLFVVILVFYFALKREGSDLKVSRYEAGNVPKYEARVKYGMQYLGFFIIFASFEPVVLLLLLISPSVKVYAQNFLVFLLLVFGFSVPVLLASLKLSEKIEEWMWD
jgi:NADH-quinone oxidoreductase subunit A